jgi:GT2 family glycosyltransferase
MSDVVVHNRAADAHALPDVSVIIVNYNGLRFLPECLDSLANAFQAYRHEVVVIDNASVDGSQAYLRKRTDIHYIESDQNLGFTGGNNRACEQARGRVFILLNNDTRVEEKLDPLVTQALLPEVGVVGSRLAYGDGRLQFSVGFHHTPLRIFLSWLGLERRHQLPTVFRRMQTDPAFYDASHAQVDWVSGAVLATRADVWQKLKGLDDNFFMYCEDVDYCLRARNEGLNVRYAADVRVTHYEGAGKAWIGVLALSRTSRSYYEFTTKHFGVQQARWLALGLSGVFFARALVFWGLGRVFFFKPQPRALWRDKGGGYCFAANQLFLAAWRGSMVHFR